MSSQFALPSHEHTEPKIEMNMTPLIDVMLVLIIMLIITIPVQQKMVSMNLPVSIVETHAKPPVVINLEVDFDGSLAWNGNAIASIDALEAKLAMAAKSPDNTEFHVHANHLASYQAVAGVLSAAQRQGVKNIGLVGNEQFSY